MNVLKFCPKDPFLLPDEKQQAAAVDLIVKAFPEREIFDGTSPLPQFVDCGDSLEGVYCPFCKKELDSEDWACLMDSLYSEEGFSSLEVTLPCCGKNTGLDRLIYKEPCAFSCFEIDVTDAGPSQMPKDLLKRLSEATGIEFTVVTAHI